MKLFIFDVGGVFRDSSKAINEGFRKGFCSEGLDYKFDAKSVWHLRGIGKYNNSKKCITALLAISRSGESLQDILNKSNAEKIIDHLVDIHISKADDLVIDRIRARYKEFFYSPQAKKLIKLYPMVKEAIDLLSSRFKLAIFTNTRVKSVYRDLKNIDMNKFSLIISEEDLENKKPSGEGIVKICNQLKIPSNNAFYVGDSVVDIQAAKNAGCKSIALLEGMGLEKHLRKENPDYVFKNLYEAARYFYKY
jgi:HAD superfamily hydrolase (TIGR01549 family)